MNFVTFLVSSPLMSCDNRAIEMLLEVIEIIRATCEPLQIDEHRQGPIPTFSVFVGPHPDMAPSPSQLANLIAFI